MFKTLIKRNELYIKYRITHMLLAHHPLQTFPKLGLSAVERIFNIKSNNKSDKINVEFSLQNTQT